MNRHIITVGALAALALAACGTSATSTTRPAATAAVPVLHLTGGDQGIICADVNAMNFTDTSDPFGTEASVTAGKFQVSTAEAAKGVASAIRARCPNLAHVIPAGQ